MPLPKEGGGKSDAKAGGEAAAATTTAAKANPFASMTVTAKQFVPKAPLPGQETEPRTHADSVSFDDFGGYQNPYSNTIDVEKEKRKLLELENEQELKKTYSMEFMKTFKAKCRTRPSNMALLVLPHKKRQVKLNQATLYGAEKDAHTKFTTQVGRLRILLNKISKDNFDKVQHQLMNGFDFNPSLLIELMKIIFMKATTETAYLDLYIKLCVGFFKKFDDAEHHEMNFRKLLLNRCQKQFYKMLQREQIHRRERRASMEEALLKDDLSQDFNKPMLFVFDQDELKMRQQD